MRCGFLRICSLLLAVSVLFAGMSAGHAAGFQGGGHVHVAHFGAGASDGTHLNSSPQHKADCDKPSEEKAGAGNKSSGGMDGCCHVACFPSVAAQDLSDLSAHVFEAERLCRTMKRLFPIILKNNLDLRALAADFHAVIRAADTSGHQDRVAG